VAERQRRLPCCHDQHAADESRRERGTRLKHAAIPATNVTSMVTEALFESVFSRQCGCQVSRSELLRPVEPVERPVV
jgi:hypothetical protein